MLYFYFCIPYNMIKTTKTLASIPHSTVDPTLPNLPSPPLPLPLCHPLLCSLYLSAYFCLACTSNFVYHILNCVSFICSSIKVVTHYWSMNYDFSSLNTFIYRTFNAFTNSISQFVFCNIVAYKKSIKKQNEQRTMTKTSGRSVITWMKLEGILLK